MSEQATEAGRWVCAINRCGRRSSELIEWDVFTFIRVCKPHADRIAARPLFVLVDHLAAKSSG